MECPDCGIEAVFSNSEIEIRNGKEILIQDARCPKCGKQGRREVVVGEVESREIGEEE